MDTHTLGKTGLNVSKISFGASALGGVFRDIDEGDGIAAVHEALEEGINYFDVAPAYGGTVAGAGEIIHGKVSMMEHQNHDSYAGLPSPLAIARYHFFQRLYFNLN